MATIFELRQCEMKAFVNTLVCYSVRSVFFIIYLIAYIRVVYAPEMWSAKSSSGLTA